MMDFLKLRELSPLIFRLIRGSYRSLLMVVSVAIVTTFIAKNPYGSRSTQWREGEVASREILAPRDIKIIDQEATEKRKSNAINLVVPVYDLDPEAQLIMSERIKRGLDYLKHSGTSAKRDSFQEVLGLIISDSQWRSIQYPEGQAALKKIVARITKDHEHKWIVDDNAPPDQAEIGIRDIRSGEEFRATKKSYDRKVVLLSEIRDKIRSGELFSSKDFAQISETQLQDLVILASNLVEADLIFNPMETSARRDEAIERVEPIWAEVEKDAPIVRAGEKIERRHLLLLNDLEKQKDRLVDFRQNFQFALLLVVLIFVFFYVGKTNFKKFKLSMRDQATISGMFIFSLSILAFLAHLFDAARNQTAFGPSFMFLLPVAFGPMTLRLFSSMEITTFFSIVMALCVAWMQDNAFFGLAALVTILAGASRMRHINQRFDVFKAGVVAGGVKALIMIIGYHLELVPDPQFGSYSLSILAIASFCLISGILSASLVLGLQPLIEFLGYTTDLRLMELASTNHPLLRDLIFRAPGTYFHSFTVSQLAEKAAESIHANALFARVASLYHDIGKIKKPHYFIENIKGDNKHDKLAPTMSALIISNHVREGIELGMEYKLPPSIIEIIPQHHGTALISYFFDKAQKLSTEEHNDVPDERDFRYPGPKPQTREGAIIMLADAVEATVKSMNNRSADQVRQVVHQTIQRFFLDGQLDECELTLKDLNSIASAFLQVLQGIYHQRIEYPKAEDDEDPDSIVSALSKSKLSRP